MPTPLFGAATTELTSVPCSSSTSPTVCRFIKIVFGREANSGCVMSMPESTIVTGFPGPGASTRSAPIAARHHSLGTSGSVACCAALDLPSSRSGCATTTAPAARSRASVRASTRQICSSGRSSSPPACRARSLPAPGFSCARSALAGAALASRTTVTISRRLAKAPTVVAVPTLRGRGDLGREATLSAMSPLDELDEFEAELEIRLKKEYTAVFGLFRYCVLTQDATYLCNRLDLAQGSQPNYPFFPR